MQRIVLFLSLMSVLILAILFRGSTFFHPDLNWTCNALEIALWIALIPCIVLVIGNGTKALKATREKALQFPLFQPSLQLNIVTTQQTISVNTPFMVTNVERDDYGTVSQTNNVV